MKGRLLVLAIAAAASLSGTSVAEAAGCPGCRRQPAVSHRAVVHPRSAPVHRDAAWGHPRAHAPRVHYQDWYPRYHGGFHARYFQEIGFPGGERPMRGFAW